MNPTSMDGIVPTGVAAEKSQSEAVPGLCVQRELLRAISESDVSRAMLLSRVQSTIVRTALAVEKSRPSSNHELMESEKVFVKQYFGAR